MDFSKAWACPKHNACQVVLISCIGPLVRGCSSDAYKTIHVVYLIRDAAKCFISMFCKFPPSSDINCPIFSLIPFLILASYINVFNQILSSTSKVDKRNITLLSSAYFLFDMKLVFYKLQY